MVERKANAAKIPLKTRLQDYYQRTVVPTNPNWRDNAACRNENPTLFESNDPIDTAKAKEICKPCPVRGECLLAGFIEDIDLDGVWGGMTKDERKILASAPRWRYPNIIGRYREERIAAVGSSSELGETDAALLYKTRAGDFMYDPETGQVLVTPYQAVSERVSPIFLSDNERYLVGTLLANHGEPVNREKLRDKRWTDRNITNLVSKIREKIGQSAKAEEDQGAVLELVYGVGYRITEEDKPI